MTAPTAVAKVVLRWDQANGTEAINVLHLGKFGGGNITTADCEAIGADLADWWQNADFKTETNVQWKQYVDTATVLREIVVSDTGPGPSVQATTSVGTAGNNIGTPLPIESCAVSTWRTLTPGRSGRGRTFWCGLNDDSLDDAGGLNAGRVAEMQDSLQALIDGWGTEGIYFPSVWSPTLGVNTICTSVTMQSVIHHQKRRNS